jgi:Flp pilus assembly protein CpaB
MSSLSRNKRRKEAPVTKSRLRNLALPLGLAVLAAVLVGIYITSYRNSVAHGAGLVKVLVAARDIPAGTEGSSVAGGGYLKSQTVPRRAVVPGSVTSGAPLTSLVTAGPIYKGEQITLRQFKPIAQGGIFAKFSGTERAVVTPGEPRQLLAGTLSDGDHVDVVANTKYQTGGFARATTRVVLRNLLVLKAPDSSTAGSVGTPDSASMTLAMTDKESQTMLWTMKNASWFLVLRPTSHPRNSRTSLDTLYSVLSRGLPKSSAQKQIAGMFPESVNGQ